jgi:septum site-determining protein MinC
MALVLAPEFPLRDWFAELDSIMERSPGFFDGRATIVDISVLKPQRAELVTLLAGLKARSIRVMAIEGAVSVTLDETMPPLVSGGRPAGLVEVPEVTASSPALPVAPAPANLVIDSSIRSGQQILHVEGDVTILGSVASGSEIVAGGSIHVYGALRGRAIAGCAGDANAKIFCSKFEAELIAIDGLYKTADDLGHQWVGQRVQVSLDADAIIVKPLD